VKQIINLFLPNLTSLRAVFNEVSNTSISREKFIDFTKIIGLFLLIINSFFFLRLEESGGEIFIKNLSVSSESLIVITWFTAGMSLFFFSMGFNNLIAWYSNVGRDGSQWNYLVDRINTLLGPVLVWIFSSTIVLNILSRSYTFPSYLTTSEDGIMPSIEFILWPLWLVSIYLVMVLFAPLTIFLHKKYPYATLFTLFTLTILIDNIDFSVNFSYIKLFNYLFFWIAVHQIGYFYADGKIQQININFFRYVTVFAYGYLFYQITAANKYLSLASYRLSSINNEDPPTTLYLVASIGLICLVFTFKNVIEKILSNQKLWLVVSHIHANIYTIYLWHLFIFFLTYLLGGSLYLIPLLFIIVSFFFGNYERSVFKLSSNLVKRVNPLQPWPSPIKARFSINNFVLAWFSALFVLLGVFHLTLGGVGQDGFFTIREFYFLRSNTYEGLGRILIGLLLLNVTVRGLKYKKRVLSTAILFVISSIFTRNIVNENFTYFEIYFSSFSLLLFIFILVQNSNYKSVSKVK
jgi:hypothetical protein